MPYDDIESLEQLAEAEQDYGTDDIIAAHGYDARCTPIDTLMAAPPAMGLAVAGYYG